MLLTMLNGTKKYMIIINYEWRDEMQDIQVFYYYELPLVQWQLLCAYNVAEIFKRKN